MTPHKHAEVIKAWADGAEIQFRNPESLNPTWSAVSARGPLWFEYFEYRVKPQPKKCVPYKRYICHLHRGDACVGLVYKEQEWNPEGTDTFIRWIDTEWQEHEYE